MSPLEGILLALLGLVIVSTLIRDYYHRRLVKTVVRLVYARATMAENASNEAGRSERERIALAGGSVGFREAAGEIERRLLDKPEVGP